MANPVAAYIFLSLFGVSSIAHLVICFLEKEKLRHITKCFPIGFLAIAAFVGFPSQPLLGSALLCGMIGDGLLLKKKENGIYLFLGALFFLANHVLFIVAMLVLTAPLEIGYYIGMGVYYGLFLAAIPLGIKVTKKAYLGVGMAFYFATLTSDFIVSLLLCINGYLAWFFLTLAGSVMFLASDTILGLTMYKKDIKRRDFYIMLTYLLAQALLLFGIGFGLIL